MNPKTGGVVCFFWRQHPSLKIAPSRAASLTELTATVAGFEGLNDAAKTDI